MQGRFKTPKRGRRHFAQETLPAGEKKEIHAKPDFVSINPVFGGIGGEWLQIWVIIPKYRSAIWLNAIKIVYNRMGFEKNGALSVSGSQGVG